MQILFQPLLALGLLMIFRAAGIFFGLLACFVIGKEVFHWRLSVRVSFYRELLNTVVIRMGLLNVCSLIADPETPPQPCTRRH